MTIAVIDNVANQYNKMKHLTNPAAVTQMLKHKRFFIYLNVLKTELGLPQKNLKNYLYEIYSNFAVFAHSWLNNSRTKISVFTMFFTNIPEVFCPKFLDYRL